MTHESSATSPQKTSVRYRITASISGAPKMYVLNEKQSVRVGSAETCEITIAEPDIAPYHLVIVRNEDQVVVRPLVARRNVWLDKEPLGGEEGQWQLGQELLIGTSVLKLTQEDDAPAPPADYASGAPIMLERVDTGVIAIEPGRESAIDLVVENTSSIEQDVQFKVIDCQAGMWRFEPPTISLRPAENDKVRLYLTLPRQTLNGAGSSHFTVQSQTLGSSQWMTLTRIAYDLRPFYEPPRLTLNPRRQSVTSIESISWLPPQFRAATARFTISITNRSNHPEHYDVKLSADPELHCQPDWQTRQVIEKGETETISFQVTAPMEMVEDRQRYRFAVVVQAQSKQSELVREEGAVELVRPLALLGDGLRRVAPLVLGVFMLLLLVAAGSVLLRMSPPSQLGAPTPSTDSVAQAPSVPPDSSATAEAILALAQAAAAKTNEAMASASAPIQTTQASLDARAAELRDTEAALVARNQLDNVATVIAAQAQATLAQLQATEEVRNRQLAALRSTSGVAQQTQRALQSATPQPPEPTQPTAAPAVAAVETPVPEVRQVELTGAPEGTFVAGAPLPPIVVRLLDRQKQPALVNVPIKLTLLCQSGCPAEAARLNGDTTVLAQEGVAEFEGLSVQKTGTYKIEARGGGRGQMSGNFTVAAGQATQLAFIDVKKIDPTNEPFTLNIQVEARDSFGNVDTNFGAAGSQVKMELFEVYPAPSESPIPVMFTAPLRFITGTLSATASIVVTDAERYYQFRIRVVEVLNEVSPALSRLFKARGGGSPDFLYPARLPGAPDTPTLEAPTELPAPLPPTPTDAPAQPTPSVIESPPPVPSIGIPLPPTATDAATPLPPHTPAPPTETPAPESSSTSETEPTPALSAAPLESAGVADGATVGEL